MCDIGIEITKELLEGREARCICGKTVPSTLALDDEGYLSTRLAFFEYRGPASRKAKESCIHCRYHEVAHGSGREEDIAKGVRPRRNVVEEGHCPGFEAGPYDTDTFYCGCRGWD